MKHPFEIIYFSLFNLDLQEPMAFITNLLLFTFSFYAAFRLRFATENGIQNFFWFFISFGLSTFFGAFGHVLFLYTGMLGKIPSWTMGVVAGIFAARGILCYYNGKFKTQFTYALWIKSILLLTLSLATMKFVFVAIDAIFTYLFFCGFLAFRIWKKGEEMLRFFVYGVLVLLPSAFVFLLNLNIHLYLNRDDLSHLFMLACIVFFFLGSRNLAKTA